jgi:hypothetical protein
MLGRFALLVLAHALCSPIAVSQEVATYKSAIIALAEDPLVRSSFEDGLAAKARENRYDAVVSYDIVPDVADLDEADVFRTLASNGIQAVLMLRPAAIGAGSSLESVRNSVSQSLFADMRAFANQVSTSGSDDLIAVVHMAIYTLTGNGAQLISAGAVWLDETVESQDEGIERLQNLVLANVDGVRPAIRQHLGLPPLPQ